MKLVRITSCNFWTPTWVCLPLISTCRVACSQFYVVSLTSEEFDTIRRVNIDTFCMVWEHYICTRLVQITDLRRTRTGSKSHEAHQLYCTYEVNTQEYENLALLVTTLRRTLNWRILAGMMSNLLRGAWSLRYFVMIFPPLKQHLSNLYT